MELITIDKEKYLLLVCWFDLMISFNQKDCRIRLMINKKLTIQKWNETYSYAECTVLID